MILCCTGYLFRRLLAYGQTETYQVNLTFKAGKDTDAQASNAKAAYRFHATGRAGRDQPHNAAVAG